MLAERIGFAELRELARRQDRRAFDVDPAALSRIAGMLAPGAQQATDRLRAVVEFGEGPEGLAQLDLELSGHLPLLCQRCLEPLQWPVQLQVRLTVLASEGDANRIPDPFDSVVLEAEGLHLATIIEDEILADLPMAPVHRGDRACQQSTARMVDSDGEQRSASRPFANLAALMRSGHEDRND